MKDVWKDVCMQIRCVNCKREQYAPAVAAISEGEHPCVWCGYTPPVMTYKEWEDAYDNTKQFHFLKPPDDKKD